MSLAIFHHGWVKKTRIIWWALNVGYPYFVVKGVDLIHLRIHSDDGVHVLGALGDHADGVIARTDQLHRRVERQSQLPLDVPNT